MDGILPPHSENAEQALLASMLIDPECIPQVAALLTPAHFYIVKHGWIFESIAAAGDSADMLTVSAGLAARGLLDEVGGYAYLSLLAESAPSALNWRGYARIVEDFAVRRGYIQAASGIAKAAFDTALPVADVIAQSERILDRALKPAAKTVTRSAGDIFRDYATEIEARAADPSRGAGIPTGYTDLDRLLGGGLRAGELVIIASRPGMGKTSLLNGIAANVTGINRDYRPAEVHRVVFYSMEMSENELANRYISMDTRIPSTRVRAGDMTPDEWTAFMGSSARHTAAPMWLNCESQTTRSMRDDAERLQIKHGVDLIIVDYLGLFDDGGDDAYQKTSAISHALKGVARSLNIALVAAAQLSRSCEMRSNKRPVMSDLRDSGSIEQDMDVGIFIYRDEYYDANTEHHNIAEVAVGKNRNGATGIANLYFSKEHTRFANLIRTQVDL